MGGVSTGNQARAAVGPGDWTIQGENVIGKKKGGVDGEQMAAASETP